MNLMKLLFLLYYFALAKLQRFKTKWTPGQWKLLCQKFTLGALPFGSRWNCMSIWRLKRWPSKWRKKVRINKRGSKGDWQTTWEAEECRSCVGPENDLCGEEKKNLYDCTASQEQSPGCRQTCLLVNNQDVVTWTRFSDANQQHPERNW